MQYLSEVELELKREIDKLRKQFEDYKLAELLCKV